MATGAVYYNHIASSIIHICQINRLINVIYDT